MDEEEYQEEEQSDSKINLGSFFERMDSVEKVASNALSKANANFSIIENQKALINSLNVSIEAIETKVRDIANYIIIEKKITKDEEADKLVEEQDKEQKDQMIERLMGMKGDQGDQGEPGQPEEEKGGNPIMSFLKGLATLGIAAFVTTQMWPVLIPLIGPLLGKLGFGLMAGAGTLLGGFLGAQLLKVPLGIGKKMGPAVEKGIKENFEKVGEAVKKGAESIGKGGKLEIPAVTETQTGAEEVESNEDILEGDESMRDTLSEKDLMVTPGTRVDEYGAEGGGKPSSGDLSMFDEDENESNFKTEYKEGSFEFSSTSEKMEGVTRFDRKTGKAYLLGEEVSTDDYMEYINTPRLERQEKIKEILSRYEENKVEPVTENKDLDLSLNTVEDEKDMTGVNDANILSQVLENPATKGNQIVAAPSNKPNTTTTDIKLTKIPIHFLNTISNPHLSITGDEIPPEFYRQYT